MSDDGDEVSRRLAIVLLRERNEARAEVERLRQFQGDAIRAITAYTEACTALTAENARLRDALNDIAES